MLACLPKLTIAESPRFHPHSWWSCLPRCQLVSSISTGAAISDPNLTASVSRSLRSSPVPQSPELDDLPSTISLTMLLLAVVPAAG